jgi:hypothetical protein
VGHDEQAGKERATRLREEIERLKAGRASKPDSPREFTDQEAEAAEHAQPDDQEAPAEDR